MDEFSKHEDKPLVAPFYMLLEMCRMNLHRFGHALFRPLSVAHLALLSHLQDQRVSRAAEAQHASEALVPQLLKLVTPRTQPM